MLETAHCAFLLDAFVQDDAPPEGSGLRVLIGNQAFLRFLLCRTSFVMAQQMMAVAVGWDIYARTGDVFALGLVGLFLFLPVIVLTLPGGVAADRLDRRKIIGIALLVDVFTALAIGFWFWTGDSRVWPVYLLLMVSGSATAMLHPAMQSTVPNLVHRDHLAFAIAGSSTVTKVAQMFGPAAGGLLIAIHPYAVYGICAGFFLVGCISILSIRHPMRIERPEPFGMDLLFGGFRFIARTPTVLAAISIDLVVVLFGGVVGLLPVFAVDILKVDATALGVMRGMPAFGALGVGLLLSAHRLPWPVGRTFYVSLVLFSASILLFGLTRSYWIGLLALLIYGATDMVSVYIRQALIQLGTPDALRGRVSSVNSVMVLASNQLGDFRAGMMAGVIGAPAAVVLGGGVTLAATALWSRIFPQLGRIKSL